MLNICARKIGLNIIMETDMKHTIDEIPNENPIKCVLLMLGFFSFMATNFIISLQNESFLIFKVTAVAGFICGLFALSLGFKLVNIRLNGKQNPDVVAY